MRPWLRGILQALFVCVLVFVPALAFGLDSQLAGPDDRYLLPGVRLGELVSVIVYGFVGMALSMVGYLVFEKVAPYPVRKEIEEDQNTALGIVIGSVILSIAIVVAAAISG